MPNPISSVILALALAAPAAVHAQLVADKPIRLIVPFAAGSGTDVAARMLATALTESTQRTIVVENKPGALAVIGTDYAAKAAPDGHTLVATGSTAIAAAPSLFKKLPYDPVKDFAPIYLLATAPLALFVASDSPMKSLADAIEAAKRQPGRLSYASGNATGAVAGEMLKQLAGIDLIHVPYKASPQALTDVAGGTVSMMFNDIAGATPLIKAGRLRALAVTSKARSSRLEGVPTLVRSRLYRLRALQLGGDLRSGANPGRDVRYLAGEINKITARPEFREQFQRVGLDLVAPSEPAGFAEFVESRDRELEPADQGRGHSAAIAAHQRAAALRARAPIRLIVSDEIRLRARRTDPALHRGQREHRRNVALVGR